MVSGTRHVEAVEALVLSAERLRSLFLPNDLAEELIDLSSLVSFRRNLGENRPVLVGFIGCTGTGKSTLFNSLAGKTISAVGWRAHNTRGPLLLARQPFLSMLEQVERRFHNLLMPLFKREIISMSNNLITTGMPESLYIIVADSLGSRRGNDLPGEFIDSDSQYRACNNLFIDLPDINTTFAGEENLLALRVQPWLDTVVFVTDDETIYHRDYEQHVRLADELEQPRVCVLNNRGRDRVDISHPDLEKVRAFFGVEKIHVLPEIAGGSRFINEPSFLELRDCLDRTVRHAPEHPLLKKIADLAGKVIQENGERRLLLDNIEKSVLESINKILAREQPVPLQRILDDDVLFVLRHLGLRRFSVSSIYEFIRRVARSGAVKRSFRIAFGARRGDLLSHVLRLDRDKLTREVTQRLSDHVETITGLIRRHQNAGRILDLVPLMRGQAFGKEMLQSSQELLQRELHRAADQFELQCRQMIASDTIADSIVNDPHTAVAVVLVLAADIAVIPGFGSWLLVPSLFKYVPLGKFESAKRKFQRNIHGIIHGHLLRFVTQIRQVRGRLVLEESDPVLSALRTCANYTRDEN